MMTLLGLGSDIFPGLIFLAAAFDEVDDLAASIFDWSTWIDCSIRTVRAPYFLLSLYESH
ncbi:hypothetical protein V1520DRAFT_370701 [Lipomyces starkeyi]|uniref:Uncharacterized protein n=1 Tax=Lipomyces starkeyi NRRL Y-11557 TaxID=675824 RepID=A0A1E3Q4W1_LIPST|nr:hypothetical protein LIPSTDRAFT_72347 [Lipomyces starkeyi NRRL Y-11557]